MQSLTIDSLMHHGGKLKLSIVVGKEGLDRSIKVPRIQKPGLALTGYEEQLHKERLLTLGGTEVEFLASATAEQRRVGIETMMAAEPACVVLTRGLEPPVELIAACEKASVPLLVTSLVSSEFIVQVTQVLQQHLSPKSTVHGVLLDVHGVGILLMGKSGIGKSEAALDLLVRGHRLVADDVVEVRRIGPNIIIGSGAGIIQHHMEIRGLGILNIKDLFGNSSIRQQKKVDVVIELCEWTEGEEYDRLGIDDAVHPLLGEEIPRLRLPVRPGRNIATVIEVAARNQLLKAMGVNSARAFAERLSGEIGARTREEPGA